MIDTLPLSNFCLSVQLTTFDVDVRLNVFEGNIRLLGGLLSAHLLASDERLGPLLMPGGYAGGLLDLAHSLGLRLLPAFFVSPTGGCAQHAGLLIGCPAREPG